MAQSPVLIVGAGPTGLVLAIELARRGVPFRLIDRRPAPLGRDRAVVVKSRSLEMLAGMGLVDRFLQRGRVIRAIDLFSGGTKVASVPLDGLDSPFPFDLCIPEEETERILSEELEQLGGRIERGVEFAGLEQRRRSVRARLRTLQDGERSVMRAGWSAPMAFTAPCARRSATSSRAMTTPRYGAWRMPISPAGIGRPTTPPCRSSRRS